MFIFKKDSTATGTKFNKLIVNRAKIGPKLLLILDCSLMNRSKAERKYSITVEPALKLI
jgi:hypothetical protein